MTRLYLVLFMGKKFRIIFRNLRCSQSYISQAPYTLVYLLSQLQIERLVYFHLKKYVRCESTGWISEIWKNVQVNIHHTHTASTETNDTSEKSPGIQL